MTEIINKSAINVLDEFCKRKRQPPPVYTFASDGIASDFACTVKSFNETKTGKAKSKKKAKHAAAQQLIDHLRNLESFKFDLIFLNVSSDPVVDTKVSSSTTNAKKRKAAAKPETNYIGKLLEYCVKNKLPPASFDAIEHTTNVQNHLSEFSMKCHVNDVEKEGKGFSKKEAKQKAAMEVLGVLMARQTEPKDNLKIVEPPPKRLKSQDKSQATDTSSTTSENIVPKIPFSDSDDEGDETSDVVRDCDSEGIDSTEVNSLNGCDYDEL